MNRNYVYPAKTLNKTRSKFDVSHTHKTSFLHGKLVPIDVIEVLPGDTFSVDLASLIRMSTPIAPIMDNIVFHCAAYFVPNRLSFEHWEEVMGANKTGAWKADDNSYTVPVARTRGSSSTHSIGDYMGLPALPTEAGVAVNALPGRDYFLIWNEFYRNENVSAPVPVQLGSTAGLTVANEVEGDPYEAALTYSAGLMPLGKYSDLFTKCLPEPQKHDPISIIPEDLQVGFVPLADANITANTGITGLVSGDSIEKDVFVQGKVNSSTGYSATNVGAPTIARTAETAWNNINALRFAFQLQKFYEADARYGSNRYFEMLNGHFGVTNPDLVLQRPQFLGEINFRINVDQVLSTAGYSASSSTTVGAPGANSVTASKGSLFTGSFSEHGFIIIVCGTRHEHTYGQGYEKLWVRSNRLDYYDPVFANIGEQPIYQRELFGSVAVSPATADNIFGYQEAWAEYRFIPDRVSGLLNPSATNNLGFWTLADKFASAPVLNESFIYENRDSISRALVTGETGPDFIADFYFKTTAVREMPLFSIPGLADHH